VHTGFKEHLLNPVESRPEGS